MMTVMTFPRSRPLTWRDLEGLPDDGRRYELVDGTLIVTPAALMGIELMRQKRLRFVAAWRARFARRTRAATAA